MISETARLRGGNGETRRKTRVRGFAPWQPRAEFLDLLALVLAVLEEYAAYLPLTVRQIFYRLVGTRGYPKTEHAYKRLGELLNRARRAGFVSFDAIRDDGGTISLAPGWANTTAFLDVVRRQAENFRLDRQLGQPRRLILLCEAAGMVPQLERVAHPYGVEVRSSSGFDSTTEKYNLACDVARSSVEVLHIGDHDPSGVHVFSSIAEDVTEFAAKLGGTVAFTRLAVTPLQARKLRLPTSPAKGSDGRSFDGIGDDATATVQAEAIPPDVLARIVEDAIRERLDVDAYDRVLAAEDAAKAQLAELLAGVGR